MPKGQRLIDWTPVNDARLILTILAVENLHPNCEAVAKAFGGNVNAMAISNRLSRLRRQAASEGLVPEGGVKASTKVRKEGSGAGKAGKGGILAEGSGTATPASDNEGSNTHPARKNPAKGQKVLTGRVTKPRGSTKKGAKSHDEIAESVEGEHEDTGMDGAEGSEEGEDEICDGGNVPACIKKEEEDEEA